MRAVWRSVTGLLLAVAPGLAPPDCGAQAAATSRRSAADTSRPRFQLQRAEEDWRGWTGAGSAADRLKALPLGAAARLALGADVRLYPERFASEDFGLGTPRATRT
jgi:hypothetical protein